MSNPLSNRFGVFATALVLFISAGSMSPLRHVAAVHPSLMTSQTATVVASTTRGMSVVSIGDSVMEGNGLAGEQAWPAVVASRYGWKLANLASDGSGFVSVGDGGDSFLDQAEIAVSVHPEVVILSGSSNDVGLSEDGIDTAITTTVNVIHEALPAAAIVGVSSVWGSSPVPTQLTSIDRAVRHAIQQVGGRYVDVGKPLTGRPDLMQDGDVGEHPTADGQRALADSFGPRLASAISEQFTPPGGTSRPR